MKESLVEAWRTNHRINLLLLEKISGEGLACTLSKRGGRDVARQFAHMHDVRLHHMEKRAPDLAPGLVKFASKDPPEREALVAAHEASTAAVETFLVDVLEGAPRRRGFRKGIFTTLAYFIAHESHHRGSILLTLKECGHKVDNTIAYAIWDWDRR
ncbi:MAG: DinB family protein [Gemmatimonadota bacterium]|nr:DinB family protein [Gemmatimonadota bacterium]